MKTRRLLSAIAVLAVAAASCSTTTTEKSGTIDDAFTRVVVSGSSGRIQIERTTGTPEWLAEASYSGNEPDFVPTVVNGELIVDDSCSGFAIGDCTVDYLLSVPEGTEVSVLTGSGDVTVTSISAAVDIETGSGVVFLNTVKGPINVSTGSGDILGTKLETAAASFTAGSGSIDVAFERIVADLNAETGSGNVTAQLPDASYNLVAETGSGSLDLKISDDDTSTNMIVLRTGSGDLTIYKTT